MPRTKGLDSKHLVQGDAYPPVQNGKVRLLNMRFCPFGERTVLYLAAKNIDFDTVNVSLKRYHKPDWFLERNPFGYTPTIEKDGTFVFDSAIINEYLDEVFLEKRILPKDPDKRAEQRMLAERLTALLLGPIRAVSREKSIEPLMEPLQQVEAILQEDYFGGAEPGWPDYQVWPWVERIEYSVQVAGHTVADTLQPFPKFAAYMERMKARPEVKVAYQPPEVHMLHQETGKFDV